MVTLLKEIEPDYYKDFMYKDKRVSNCMYGEAKKVIYGTIEVSILFWGNIQKV